MLNCYTLFTYLLTYLLSVATRESVVSTARSRRLNASHIQLVCRICFGANNGYEWPDGAYKQ